MNAHDPNWTADLLAVWYWDAFAAGERTRLAFEFAYAPPRPPDRALFDRARELDRIGLHAPISCGPGHHDLVLLTGGRLVCRKCGVDSGVLDTRRK